MSIVNQIISQPSYQFYPTDRDLFARIDAMPTYDAGSRAELKAFAEWLRAAIDFSGRDLLRETDFTSLQYIQARTRIHREFQFKPRVFTSADCAALKSLRDAIESKKTQLQTDKMNRVIDDRWFNIYTNVVNEIAGIINSSFSNLACDVVLTRSDKLFDTNLIEQTADKAISNSTGNGIDYTKWSIISIIVIVVIVVLIKLLRNG